MRGHRRGRRRGPADVGLRDIVRPGRGRDGRRPLRGAVRAGGSVRPDGCGPIRLVPRFHRLAVHRRAIGKRRDVPGRVVVLAAVRERGAGEGRRRRPRARGGRRGCLVLWLRRHAAWPGGGLLRDRRPRRERQRAAVGRPRNLYDGGRRHSGRSHGAGVRSTAHRGGLRSQRYARLVPRLRHLAFRSIAHAGDGIRAPVPLLAALRERQAHGLWRRLDRAATGRRGIVVLFRIRREPSRPGRRRHRPRCPAPELRCRLARLRRGWRGGSAHAHAIGGAGVVLRFPRGCERRRGRVGAAYRERRRVPRGERGAAGDRRVHRDGQEEPRREGAARERRGEERLLQPSGLHGGRGRRSVR